MIVAKTLKEKKDRQKTPKNLARAFKLLTQLPSDFFSEKRDDPLPQIRDSFCK